VRRKREPVTEEFLLGYCILDHPIDRGTRPDRPNVKAEIELRRRLI
jgi:hypothetical protein